MLYAFLINQTKTFDRYYLYYSDVVRFSYKWNENIALIDIICTILMLSAFLINKTKTLHWYVLFYYSDVVRFSYKWNELI